MNGCTILSSILEVEYCGWSVLNILGVIVALVGALFQKKYFQGALSTDYMECTLLIIWIEK